MINYRQLHYFWSVAKFGGVTRAAEQLHLTPQTLSGQISQLEGNLGISLFRRTGRRMELTDAGRMALTYADEIFHIGSEMEEALRDSHKERPFLFRVGIVDVVPKSIAYQLLAPTLAMQEPVHLVCREAPLDRLLAEMAIHRLDMVLADRPMPPGMDVKGYSHPLIECDVAFFAAPNLAAELAGRFPENLDGAPLLIPGEDSALRVPLMRWLDRHSLHPRIVGEFDDSALMKAFGKAGAGIFPAPAATSEETELQYGVINLGISHELRERFFAISVERRLTHPAVRAVSEGAQGIFK